MSLTAAKSTLELTLDALDGARRALLRLSLGVSVLRSIVISRDRRLAVQSIVSVLVLACATLCIPGLLLVAGPLLFGVAHVTGDVRHLVIRRNLPRAWIRVVAIAAVALMGLRVAELVAPSALPYARVEVLIGWAWVGAGVVAGALLARSVARGLLAGAPVAFVLVLSAHAPVLARSLFAYAHNLVALVVWVALFRSRRLVAIPAIGAALAIGMLFASGVLVPWTHLDGLWGQRLVLESMAQSSTWPPRIAIGIGLSFVFWQAIHYMVWVAWIPQDDLCARGTATFRMTARAFQRDLGGVGVSLVLIAAIVVVVASLVRVHPTRAVYLSIAAFHGWLELAAVAFFVARGCVESAASQSPA